MSTVNQLLTNSESQEEMARQYNEAKSQSKRAYDAASEAEKAADAKYKLAKRQIPQDTKTMEEAKAEKAKARSDKEAAKKIMADYYEKEKAFNNSQKSRILGQNETKQDTIDKPTDTENLSETKAPEAGANTGSEPDDKQVGKQSDNKAAGSTIKSKGLGLQLGQSFYDSVAGAIRGDKVGNALDSAAKTAKEQAQNYRNRSATNQMEAQRAQQIANQNPYSEAGKIASVQNNAENMQTINNTSFAAGTAAARLRKTNAPDVQSQMAREDQQQNVANQRREEANTAQEENTAAEGDAETFSFKSRDLNNDRADSANLSMGTPEQPEPEKDKTEETPAKTEETQEEASKPESKPEQSEPEEKPMPSGNPQHVINWLLGSSKGQDIQPQSGADGDNGLAAWVQEKYGVQPAPKWKYDSEDPSAQKWEQMWLNDSEIPGDKQAAIQALRQGRAGEGNDASKNFDASNYDQMNKSMTVESDERIKNITACLSDQRLKSIREAYDRDGCCSPEDFMWLAAHTGGKFNHNDRDYNFFNDDDWADDNDGSVLSGYADYIKNYVYTYKPEATEIDSRIDPNQEHIGPMAQDIEKVNPACIKETPEGVKTVDTARLAMMNAGAIGDLARQMQDLVDKLKAIGVE